LCVTVARVQQRLKASVNSRRRFLEGLGIVLHLSWVIVRTIVRRAGRTKREGGRDDPKIERILRRRGGPWGRRGRGKSVLSRRR